MKSSLVTSLGFPGLQGSSIALSASIGISSAFPPTSPTVWVIPTFSDKSFIIKAGYATKVNKQYSIEKERISLLKKNYKIYCDRENRIE